MKAVLLIVLMCVTVAAQAGTVTLRIAAEPDALLPGLFPSLRIWITNEGSAQAEVPTRVALQVIPPRGEPFIAYTSMRRDDWTTELLPTGPLLLGPGETRDLSFWARDEWFGTDARFRTIGRFHLQLIADRGLDSRKLSGVTRVVDQPGLIQPLVSNETTFTALQPAGADLAVWNVIQQQSGTCTPEVTALIWRDSPRSQYAAYCVPKPADPDPLKQIAAYEASLAVGPPLHRAEVYRLNIAQEWLSRGWNLVTRDIDGAVEAYQRARSLLEPLSRTAVSLDDRRRAADLLENDVLSRDRIVELHRASRGYDDGAIRVECTCFEKLENGLRKVWFGYNNPNSKAIDIPVGNDNKFTPPPFDRKQPTTFKPGSFVFAFNVITSQPALVWHLRGKATQFKLPGATECPAGYDPTDPSTWQVEE